MLLLTPPYPITDGKQQQFWGISLPVSVRGGLGDHHFFSMPKGIKRNTPLTGSIASLTGGGGAIFYIGAFKQSKNKMKNYLRKQGQKRRFFFEYPGPLRQIRSIGGSEYLKNKKKSSILIMFSHILNEVIFLHFL